MRKKERPAIGTEMYGVFEHLYYISGHVAPVKEYCVCKGTVYNFFSKGYTEICLNFVNPDGFPVPCRYKMSEIGKKLFFSTVEAAALAKRLTEKYEQTWGWIGAPEFPMDRPWESLLVTPQKQ